MNRNCYKYNTSRDLCTSSVFYIFCCNLIPFEFALRFCAFFNLINGLTHQNTQITTSPCAHSTTYTVTVCRMHSNFTNKLYWHQLVIFVIYFAHRNEEPWLMFSYVIKIKRSLLIVIANSNTCEKSSVHECFLLIASYYMSLCKALASIIPNVLWKQNCICVLYHF